MSIDRNSPEPLYQQLYHILRSQIETGELRPGEAIPPEKRLTEQFGLSRVTARKALELLVEEGLIVRRPGKGTFVSPTRLQENQTSLYGFAELMRSKYPDHTMEVLGFEVLPAGDELRPILALAPEERVVRIKRRHMLDKRPLAYAVIHLPYDLGSLLTTQEVATTPIYALITQKGNVVIKRAVQTVVAIAANQGVADLLNVAAGSPVLLVKRITYSAQERPLEYIQLYYPGGRHELVMELHRDSLRMYAEADIMAITSLLPVSEA